MGLRPLFDDLCARLAAEHGWAVVRARAVPRPRGMTLEERMAPVAGLDDDRQLGDLRRAAADRAPSVRPRRPCSASAWAACTRSRRAGTGRFDRAVAFYGMIRVPDALAGRRPAASPLDALSPSPGRCPVLAIIGDRDRVHAAGRRRRPRGAPASPSCGTPRPSTASCTTPAGPAHRADDAADAWRRSTEFLDELARCSARSADCAPAARAARGR